jgi:hypothetical protein
MFLGLEANMPHGTFLLRALDTGKLLRSDNVDFLEEVNAMEYNLDPNSVIDTEDEDDEPPRVHQRHGVHFQGVSSTDRKREQPAPDISLIMRDDPDINPDSPSPPAKASFANAASSSHVLVDQATADELPTPQSYNEFLKLPPMQRELWQRAIDEEINNLSQSNSLIPVPAKGVENHANSGKPVIMGSKWLFKIKKPENRLKCRLTAIGTREPVTKVEAYSPTADKLTTRIAATIALSKGWDTLTFDCKHAFLWASVKEPLYLAPPKGFDLPPGHVLKLNKSLYGIKSAPAKWTQLYAEILTTHGSLRQSKLDTALFFNDRIIAVTHIDDTKVWGKPEDIQKLLAVIRKHVEIEVLSPTAKYLGTEWNYDPAKKSCTITQQQFITDMLADFGMDKAKPVATPLPPGTRILPAQPLSQHDRFRELTGKLIFCLQSRIDLCFSVHELSKCSHSNDKQTFAWGKHVLRYLADKTNLGVTLYGADSPQDLAVTVATDASFANQPDMKSTTGLIVFLGKSPVSWRTTKQSLVTTSSSAAELVAISSGVDEARFVMLVANELGVLNQHPIHVLTDSQVAQTILGKNGESRRSRHLNIRAGRLREMIQGKTIEVQYLPTDRQPADALTKQLPKSTFDRHMNKLMSSTSFLKGCDKDETSPEQQTVQEECKVTDVHSTSD